MFLSARIAMLLASMLLVLSSVGSSADWKYDYRYGSESEISKLTKLNYTSAIGGKVNQIPSGFLSLQNIILESSSDFNSTFNAFDMGGVNNFSVALPASKSSDAVALDALGDFIYYQVKTSTGEFNLERCTLVGCSVLKANAADPRAIQMGLPSHTLNPQGILFTWYQNQATSPRTNQLSFFDVANAEYKVLQGDGYVTAVSRPNDPTSGINGLASLDRKPILAQLKGNQVQSWPIKTLSGSELVPVAIDGNSNPKVILLEKNESYAGDIFSCDIDWSLNEDGELNCVGGLINLGIKAEFNLGWYLDDNGFLYANNVLMEGAYNGNGGALIDVNNRKYSNFIGVGLSVRYGNNVNYFYTTIYGDIVFRETMYDNRTVYFMLEVDKDNDQLGDAWTAVYPTTKNRADFDEDLDGLTNLQEYHFESNPLKKDTDNDSLSDKEEKDNGSLPYKRDSDNDGVRDSVEIANGTNPRKRDSDGDGYNDDIDDFPLDPEKFEDYSSDTDLDGIPDYFEDRISGISSRVADSHEDLDKDGLTNLQEYNLSTLLNNPDSDNDKLPDGYEVSYQFNPLNPEEGEMDADFDQDGWSNTLEFRAETSPVNELDFPKEAVLKWTIPEIEKTNAVNTVGPDGTIYISADNNQIYSVTPDFEINWAVGVQTWRLIPVIGTDGVIYVPDKNQLKALNPDGSAKWSRWGKWSVSIGEFGGVYLASSDQGILAYINSLGEEVWSVNTSVKSRPIVGTDQIYLLTNSGLTAFSKQGDVNWFYADVDNRGFVLDDYDQSVVTIVTGSLSRISKDGELVSETKLGSSLYPESGFSSPGILIDKARNIHLMNNGSTYNSSFSSKISWPFSGDGEAVIDAAGNTYYISRGKLIVFDLYGNQKWSVDTEGYWAVPVLIGNDTLMVGKHVYQIPTTSNGNGYWGTKGKNSGNTNSICSSGDHDCDGLPLEYEELYGFDPTSSDGGLDLDGDGLTNFQEYLLGSDPNFNDTDGDQIPDAYEVKNSLNILLSDAQDDLDSDGFDNLTEYNEGTNPNENFSTPEKNEGQLRWEFGSIFEGMTADNLGTIYGFENNKVYAIDYRGDVKWAIESSPLRQPLALFSESKLLIVNQEGLRFINAETGETIISIDGYYTKVAKEQNGFIAAKAYPHSIIKYDLDANEIWHADVAYLIAQLAVNSNGVIYIGGVSNTVAAYSSIGEPLWKRNVGRYSISPFAIDSLGNLAFSDIDYLYSLTEMNEFNWSPIRGNPKLNLAPVIDANDSVYFIQIANNRYFLTEVDSTGQQKRSYLLPERPGQIQLDASGSIIVSFKNELKIYSNGLERIINLRENNYQNSPVEVILLKDRLVASLKNQDNVSPNLKNIYYPNSMHTIGWSSYGGGTHNINSVCALVDSDCDGLSDSMELSIGLDPDLKDTLWDKDQDGIINIRELQLGLNPTSDDTDDDGIKDNFELLNGLDPLSNDANDDADQDGYSNLVEYQAGSDLNDASATALLETGVKQWEKTVSSRNFIVGPDSTSYVIEGDDVIAYNVKGLELWRNLAPNQYRARSRGMMLANSEHLTLLSQYQLVVYDVITGEQLWKIDGNFDTFAANGSGQIYLSSNQGLFLYDLLGAKIRQLDSNSLHNQLIVDRNGGYYFTPSRSVYAYDVQGNRVWTKSYNQIPQNLMLDPTGDIRFILSGELYKLDSNGNEKWRRKPSYSNSSSYRSVIGLNGTSYLYGSNYFMVAIDENGKELWNKSVGYSIDSDLSINKDNSIKFLSNSKLISVNSKGVVSELTLRIPYSPYSLTITDEQLFVSDGNKISKLYSDQKGLAFSWATKGAGNHNRRSPCGLIDSDCDGLPNSYEIEVGLNPQLHDILNDIDGDGLNNITELGLGSDIFARDTDSDGMPDKYEYTFGLDLLSHDAFEDADADGYTNFDEYSVKSDPNDPLSTALRENGAQQWSHSGQFKESAVDKAQNSYVVQGSTLVKYDQFGSSIWQVDLGYSDVSLMPTVIDGELLILLNPVRNYIQAYNAITGHLLWNNSVNNPKVVINNLGEIYVRNSSKVEKMSHGGAVIWSKDISGYHLLTNLNNDLISTSARTLYNYSSSGISNWNIRLNGNINNVSLDLHGDYYLAHESSLSKVSRSGQLLWTKQVGSSPSAPLLDLHSNIYFISNSQDVKKLDINGNLLWSSRISSNPTGEMNLGSDGKLYVPHYQSVSTITTAGIVSSISMPNQRTIFSVKPIEQSLYVASELTYKRIFNHGAKSGAVWSSTLGGLHNRAAIWSHDDLDGDGLSDSYEQSVGLDHTRKDTFEDADHDGANNLTEIQLGLDPLDEDSDDDGMKDGYEITFGLNPKANDAYLDLDQDGFNNLKEFNAGSKANDSASLASLEVGANRWSNALEGARFSIGENGNIFTWSNNVLYGLDKYGEELWQLPMSSLNHEPISLPDNKLIAFNGNNLSLVDVNSGVILWSVDGGNYSHALLGKNKNIYALDRNRRLVSFDLSGNKLFTSTRAYDALVRQSDGTIIGTDYRYIYLISELGERIYNRGTGINKFSPVALTLNSNILASTDNYLYKFDNSGHQLWRTYTGHHSSSTGSYSPLVDIHGTSYTLFGETLFVIDSMGKELGRKTVSDVLGAPVLSSDGRIFIPGHQKVIIIANLSEKLVESIIALPDFRSHYKLQVVGDKLIVAGTTLLQSIYVGNDSVSSTLQGWTSLKGGSHNGSLLCGLENFDCDSVPDSRN